MTEDQLNSIIQFLIEHGINAKRVGNDSILFPIVVDKKEYFMECKITDAFPYEIPEIVSTDELFEIINGLPHVSYWKTVCTFDETTTIPNFNAPNELVLATINKAIQNVNNGLSGTNKDDYVDEFKSYWENYPGIKKMYLLGDVAKYSDSCWYNETYISHKKGKLGKDAKKAIFIDAVIDYNNDLNFKRFVDSLDKSNKTRLLKYLNDNYSKQNLIIFRNHIGGKTIIEGLFSPIYEQIKGFRKGYSLLLINRQKEKLFTPVSIIDSTQQYLYNRGGAGILETIKRVAVIGCGSFGSYLCESLMEYGIAYFLLVDNQVLFVDNIARHFCGFDYVNHKKAEAVATKLTRHNPNISCTPISDNVHTFLNESVDKLNEMDVIFVAIGNVATDKRIFDYIQSGQITKPVVFIWGEPYCIACHAVIINNNQPVFPLLYDVSCNYVDKVVNNADEFFKREAGCRSTYIPYSAHMIKRFIGDILYLLFTNNMFDSQNHSITWLGDLALAEKVGAEISDEYIDAVSFTSKTKIIS